MSRKRPPPRDLYEYQHPNHFLLTISPSNLETNYLRPTEKEITEAVIPINLQGKKPCTPKTKPNTYLLVNNAFNNPFGQGGTRKRRRRKKRKKRKSTKKKRKRKKTKKKRRRTR